jgi:hypothetical protein
MFPSHWNSFLIWLQSHSVNTTTGISSNGFVPCIPTFISNHWYLRSPHSVWSQWFVRFIFEKGWHSLYTNFPEQKSLIFNFRESDLTSGSGSGSMNEIEPLLNLTTNLLTFPSSNNLPLYDFHFNSIFFPSILQYRSSLYPPRLCTFPLSSFDDFLLHSNFSTCYVLRQYKKISSQLQQKLKQKDASRYDYDFQL